MFAWVKWEMAGLQTIFFGIYLINNYILKEYSEFLLDCVNSLLEWYMFMGASWKYCFLLCLTDEYQSAYSKCADKILPLQKLLVGNIIETIHKNKLRSS